MRYETYNLEITDSLMVFEFISEGPKGRILKRVHFQKFINEDDFYNLAFGDVNIETTDFDDKVISNNNDTEKVLATVAEIVATFIEKYPNAQVYAKGSTETRTRLYQMGISKNLEAIKENFEVYGFLNNKAWVDFEKNITYSAFLILLKK